MKINTAIACAEYADEFKSVEVLEQSPDLTPHDFEHDLSLTGQLLPDLRPRDLPLGARLGWSGWEPLRSSIEERVLSVLGPFPERSEALDIAWDETVEMPLYTQHEVLYNGEPGERISAIVLIPRNLTSPAPAILCPHGTSARGRLGGAIPGISLNAKTGLPRDGCQYAWELAERGFITIVWDHFTCGLRAPADSEYDTRKFEERHPEWSPLGKIIWDVARCVDFLQSLPQVDSRRIGCLGMSLGGYTTLFGAAFDPRIRASVAASGATTFRSDRDARFIWVREERNYHCIPRLGAYFERGDTPPFEIHEVAALVAPRPLLMLSGYHDQWTPGSAIMGEFTARVHDIYDQLGFEKGFTHIHHGEHHNFGRIWREMSYLWMERWLEHNQ